MSPDDLLQRVALTLRQEIGPAVEEPFAKTQAFMAAVILEKLARQLRQADAHAAADREDLVALVRDLDEKLGRGMPRRLAAALHEVQAGDHAALGGVVAAVYAERDELGPADFEAVLARVRRTLRNHLDRQLEFAS
jgi:hypothetical protein